MTRRSWGVGLRRSRLSESMSMLAASTRMEGSTSSSRVSRVSSAMSSIHCCRTSWSSSSSSITQEESMRSSTSLIAWANPVSSTNSAESFLSSART